ncbi:MAG: serine/threonine protein kinase [Myxococcales bacterium]|nr:serine/threonine protein kinase [Myxococcales bacterium]
MDRSGHLLEQRYRLSQPLGEGGMAAVYLAEDTKLGKAVAVKVLHGEYVGNPKAVQRFLQEARAISAVDHPNVVDVTDFGATGDGGVFLVMELLQGEDLKALLRREGPLPWSRLGPMVMQICAGLAATHARGIIHRDIKPSNCFRVRGGGNRDFIKVLDFGIAKVLAGPDGIRSTTGALLGTPEYMAPELPQGLAADERADVYAVGVLMYKLLTGTAPFVDEGYVAILTQHMYEPVEPPRRRAPERDIPAAVEAVILRALEKDRGARYPGMRALAEAVAATLPGAPSIDRWLSEVTTRDEEATTRREQVDALAPAPTEVAAAASAPASEVPSEVLPFADTRRVEPRRRGWPLGTIALAIGATLVAALVMRAFVPARPFDVVAAQAQVQGIVPELRACGAPIRLWVDVGPSGEVTRVDAAREVRKTADPAVLECLRERLGRERFAPSDRGSPFRVDYE